MENLVGPRLSDFTFFSELIDCTIPGLEGIPEAVAAGDYVKCRRLFAAQVREKLKHNNYFSIPYKAGANRFTFPGETEEEAVERISKLQLISVGIPHQFDEKVDWFANPTYNQYKEWTWQLSRHSEWKLLAHQYRLTGDEKHAETFVGLFDSWVKQAVVPDESVGGGDTLCWRTLECGIRMGNSWPHALFSFCKSPHFTDDLLVDWYKSVWEHGNRLHLQHRTGNWLVMEMNGLAQVGIFYPQLKKSKEWLVYAVQTLTGELDKQVYPDGFQYELAPGYHCFVISNYTNLLRIASVFEVSLPEAFMNCIERMLELLVKLMRPNTLLPEINDSSGASVNQYISGQMALFEKNQMFQWICRDRQGCGQPEYTSVVLEYAGMAIFRTGWGEMDTWGLLDAGPFGTGHQHEDKLNLLIHARGKDILTECGTYDYDDSQMRKYCISTRSHNTIRVNGMDQNRRGCYHWEDEDIKRKADMVYRLEADFDYVQGVYSEGYGNCEIDTAFKDIDINDLPRENNYMGATHVRSVLFVKNSKVLDMLGQGSCNDKIVPFFIVIDRLFSEEENEYEMLWHVDAQAVALQGMDVQADFLHIKNSLKDIKRDGVSIIRCERQPQWQGWKKGPTRLQGDDAPLPTVRYTTHAADIRVVTLLYPDENCPFVCVESDDDVTKNEFVLVMKDGRRLVFDEEDFKPICN